MKPRRRDSADRLPGETTDEYTSRIAREAPPLSASAKRLIRAAVAEYWTKVDRSEREARRAKRQEPDEIPEARKRRRRRGERREGDRRRLSLRVAFERRKGERREGDRRELE